MKQEQSCPICKKKDEKKDSSCVYIQTYICECGFEKIIEGD